MAQIALGNQPTTFHIAESMHQRLHDHLFPGDGDEHAAVVLASIVETSRGSRFMAHELHLAKDGVDFVSGVRGYKMLKGEFITPLIVRARNESLAYFAIHNHGGGDSVAFSSDDLASHERGYPALLDIGQGVPVGALVFAKSAVAADIWFSRQHRRALDFFRIVGTGITDLYSKPVSITGRHQEKYDRLERFIGLEGHARIAGAKVAIIGLGGAGSQLAALLSSLGVDHFVLIDPDIVETTNIPRLSGARNWHAMSLLTRQTNPKFIRAAGKLLSTSKVRLAQSVIRRNNPSANVEVLKSDFCADGIEDRVNDCDYIFLAADTHRARLKFNAIIHQFLIPGVQVGAKITRHKETKQVNGVFSVVRPVTPDKGCLLCNELISPSLLQHEAASDEQVEAQRYGLEENEPAASVNTLNAVATSHAANDFMMQISGRADFNWNSDYEFHFANSRTNMMCEPRKSDSCIYCGNQSGTRKGAGPTKGMPV